MKIAIVITVKDEERLLQNNFLYHHFIGVDKIYVYFDNSSDGGRKSIENLSFVEVNNSVEVSTYQGIDFLEKFTSQANEHHTARQCLNTYHASEKCKEQGINWLISLDADELICSSLKSKSDLKSFFSEINEDIDVVNFRVFEALQDREFFGNVFAEATTFKTQFKFKNKWERVYKYIENPFLKQPIRYSYWYGQHLGKGAIRIGEDIISHNVHRYKKKSGGKIVLQDAGYILHYHAYDTTDFIKKFTNFKKHPNTFLSGSKVDSLKILLRDVVNTLDLSKEELDTYFRNNLLFSAKEIKKLKSNKVFGLFKRNENALVEIISVSQVFNELDKKR